MTTTTSSGAGHGPSDLARVVDAVAHVLPAQGPISIFIHHNPLHAYEHLPFEEAVVQAGRRLGCEPFLSEERCRADIALGRITEQDVASVLAEQLGERAAEAIFGGVRRSELRRRIAIHGIPSVHGPTLGWLLHEMHTLDCFRDDLPPEARAAFAAVRNAGNGFGTGPGKVRELWRACLDAVARAPSRQALEPRVGLRHRDLLLAVEEIDVDAWVHPVLVRFTSAYLDQGFASWPMPVGGDGLHAAFLDVYGRRAAARCGPWAGDLPNIIGDDRRNGRGGLASLAASLETLGVPPGEFHDFLVETALALRGWAGMVRQIEERPDRVPGHAARATLPDFLAVRLLLERAALAATARRRKLLRKDAALADLRDGLRRRLPAAAPPPPQERAWRLFHAAQLCGLDAARLDRLTPGDIAALEAELDAFDGVERRKVLHLAYERRLRHRFLDALAQHTPPPSPESPAFQAILCIDERSESFRRHLEEIEPAAETLGAAGFFGVAMYYREETDAHARPLCPVAIRPGTYVEETVERSDPRRWRMRRITGLVAHNMHRTSRTLFRGAVLSALFGTLALIPLVLRVLFPWLRHRSERLRMMAGPGGVSRLDLDRRPARPPIGSVSGFTVEQMAAIVRELLESVGIARRPAPLVLVIGHGSVSLNNPHESAHDCGACGGARGGPNARAFAQMANDTRVRRLLAEQGLPIDDATWFVGAEHNTCNDAVDFFDTDLVPPPKRPLFDRAKSAVETARRRDAHERCRRFDAVPVRVSPLAALRHVEARAADLAQPRPEYGHATNAWCVVGRRARTRGLFLDRRAFLVSYDPANDPRGDVLSRLLGAVVPVVAGISLEYYFSYVDPVRYGCGTKLPHNVTSLLGVMDGALSDLRTGLPWQMVEIHEPVRLTLVVECGGDALLGALRANPAIESLVANRWVFVACLDPDTGAILELGPGGYRRYEPEHPVAVVRGDSAAWYRGKRGHLAPARIEAATA